MDGLTSSSNTGTGLTVITATSPLTFAVNTSTSNSATYTAGEINNAPACTDDLTINTGVTVSTIGAGSDLTLQAGDDVIINGTANAADVLTLTAGFNDLDLCGDLIINGSISGNVINLTSFGDFCLPSQNLFLPGSAVNITSTNGAILDCDPALSDDIDITAASITFRAATGIGITNVTGTGGAIETQTGAFEAQTATGGIFVNNGFTTPVLLNVGGVTGTINGVRVTTGGDIVLNNNGSIVALTPGDTIRSANGDVTLFAFGATADVTIATGDSPAVQAAAGGSTVSITAGRDLFLGSGGGDQADVAATNITFIAGRDVILNADSDVAAASGSINVTAGRNVSLIQTGGVGSSISTTGGPVLNITTGANGVFTLDSGAGGTVSSTAGPITITADDVVLIAPATINGGANVVTIKQVTATRIIDLGTNTAGQLGLTDAELDLISSSARLVIGATANTGNINVSAPISPSGVITLHLQTGGAITDAGGASITETNLALQAVSGIGTAGNPIDTVVSNLEAQTTTGGVFITNSGVLNVGGVLATIAGVQATTSGNITILNDATIILNGNAAEDIRTTSGNVLVGATGATSDVEVRNDSADAIDSDNGNVTIQAGRDILLGSPVDDDFGDVEANGNRWHEH